MSNDVVKTSKRCSLVISFFHVKCYSKSLKYSFGEGKQKFISFGEGKQKFISSAGVLFAVYYFITVTVCLLF